jgi:hypothetical protein
VKPRVDWRGSVVQNPSFGLFRVGALGDSCRFLDLDRTSAARECHRVIALVVRPDLGASLRIGEVAVGNLRNRRQILNSFRDLHAAVVASDEEVLEFIDKYLLAGRGLGYIDVHLLVAARLSGAGLWTADKRLEASAELLSLSTKP